MPINATIVSVEGDAVTCTLEDGQTITLSASALAKEILNQLLGQHANQSPKS